MTDKLYNRAVCYLAAKGWEPGQTVSMHSAARLMETFAEIQLNAAAAEAEKLLDGYDAGDDGFGVATAIRELAGHRVRG